MSASYSGNPNATQAPSPSPGPGAIPILSLIQDSDGLTAANLYQAWKVLADFVAYIQQKALDSVFGDGSDGNLTFDGAATVLGLVPSSGKYTMTRDIFASNLTITGASSILFTSGFRIFVRNTLTTTGGAKVSCAGNNAVGNVAGAAGAAGTMLSGFAGGVAAVGTAAPNSFGGSGGGGINAGGVATAPVATKGNPRNWAPSTVGHILGISGGVSTWTAFSGGGGGGGGAPLTGTPGAGGAGGGVLAVAARILALSASGDLTAAGGNGGNGATTGENGSGGGGGVLIVAYSSKGASTFSAATNCPGGAVGTGGGGGGPSPGAVGTVFDFALV